MKGMLKCAALACAVLALILLAGCGQTPAAAHQPAASAHKPAASNYEFSFREDHPASGRIGDLVRFFVQVKPGGQVSSLYSIMQAVTGAPITETRWNTRMGSFEFQHDWVNCTSGRSGITVPRTMLGVEESFLGPAVRPPSARSLGSGRWQVREGMAVLTVRQTGSGILRRVVGFGVPWKTKPGTVITGPALAKVTSMPGFRRGWAGCRPSPGLTRPRLH